MKSSLLAACAVASLCVVASASKSEAQSNDDALRRLEAKIDALSKENVSLRSRLSRVERAPTASAATASSAKQPASGLPKDVRETYAADMPYPVKAAPMVARPGCAQFGGWYVGGNVGANYYNNDWKDRDNFGFNFTGQDHVGDGSNSRSGWNAGGQIGWDYQSGCTVWGVVADLNWASTDINVDYRDFSFTGGGTPGTLAYSSEMSWFGTARTRAGVVVDNLLLYLTGGLAFAKFDRSFTYSTGGVAPLVAVFSDDSTRLGFVAGFGTSWNLGNNWSLGTEVLYMGFQRDRVDFLCTTCGVGAFFDERNRYEFNDSVWVTRVNLNYRFGDYGKTPVVARY